MTDCSDEFYDAFRAGIGSYHIQCGCGITYFASDEYGSVDDEAEMDALKKKAIDHPEKFIDTGDCGVSMTNLGVDYVHGCSCGTEKRYEDWIWEHRKAIAQYIKARTAKELKAAQEQVESCAEL